MAWRALKASYSAWSRAARRLVGEGYRVTAMDARGHGDSDWDPEGDYDIHRMAEDLEAIIADVLREVRGA